MIRSFCISAIALLASLTFAQASELGDPVHGESLFVKCSNCHKVDNRDPKGIGPGLLGIVGAPVGSIEGFKYSRALKMLGESGLTWTDEALDSYLENPRAFVKGTRMSFRGLPNEEDRQAIIAYLKSVSEGDVATDASDLGYEVESSLLSIEGDIAYGEYLSAECTACHRADGSNEGIPSITQWPTENFISAMHAYKDRHRDHPVMSMIAGRLGNEEIASLALYFAGLEQ